MTSQWDQWRGIPLFASHLHPHTRSYGLPKVHKPGAPVCPIMASNGSITYSVARHVADILLPLVEKNGYTLKNSADMVSSLSNCTLQKDDFLVSYDVTALFAKMLKSVEIIHNRLESDQTLTCRTNMTTAHVRDLLLMCLKTTYLLWKRGWRWCHPRWHVDAKGLIPPCKTFSSSAPFSIDIIDISWAQDWAIRPSLLPGSVHPGCWVWHREEVNQVDKPRGYHFFKSKFLESGIACATVFTKS